MAKINQKLFEGLRRRLNVGQARVYALIREVSAKNRVPRRLGALLLAGDNGLSMEKYASAQDLLELRGIPQHVTVATPAAEPVAATNKTRAGGSSRRPKTKENTVFVVHGRDAKLRDSMYDLLGALGLQPLEWGHAISEASKGKGGNPYVNEAVKKVMEGAQAIVVLLSPDDEVRLRNEFVRAHERADEGKFRFQARPNVIFETGIAVGTHHRKTVIVQAGLVKPFTDIGGMHILHLSGDEESRNAFANRLENLGCNVNRDGGRWLKAGDFTPTRAGTKAGRRRRSK